MEIQTVQIEVSFDPDGITPKEILEEIKVLPGILGERLVARESNPEPSDISRDAEPSTTHDQQVSEVEAERIKKGLRQFGIH